MKVKCNLDEFIPTPPYDLEILKLQCESSPHSRYLDYVDALLLTCHPKTLVASSNSKKDFEKVYILLSFSFSFSFLPSQNKSFFLMSIDMLHVNRVVLRITVYSHCSSNYFFEIK